MTYRRDIDSCVCVCVCRYQHLGSMMSLGAFNAAVDLALPVPSFIQSAVKATPLAPVLNTFGIKLTEPGTPQMRS